MQEMGYLGIGSQLDPGDWQEEPKRPTAEELVANILANLPPCSDLNHHCGNVLLLVAATKQPPLQAEHKQEQRSNPRPDLA